MSEPAGPAWVKRFPGSSSLTDLASPFREHVSEFIAELQRRGCRVHVTATYRPAERAYLMHWCCMIAGYRDKAHIFHQIDPQNVPAMEGVDIDWTCGNEIGIARTRAIQMRDAFGIVYPAALESRHTQRRAIDMTITGWTGTNQALWDLGKSYRVFKLVSDPPHWSDDGH